VRRLLYNSLISLFLYTLISLFLSSHSPAPQSRYPKDYFRSPLNIPLLLSGTFGELRTNHFHSGIDIKTNNEEGKPVFAVADGYVSRLRVQAAGFGNAVYLTHPNGYVSVYGHLQRFSDSLKAYVRKKQYEKESFEVDLFPEPSLFRVKKGDTVAWTGNTGLSGGPHLHFELRDAKTEHTINPLLFGYQVSDNIPPELIRIAAYPVHNAGLVSGLNLVKKFPLRKSGEGYRLAGDTIEVAGQIGFGIETYDRQDSSDNKNGNFSVELLMDGQRIYYHEVDRFSFDETRYVNSLVDYEEMLRHKQKIQKSFIAPNNKLSLYRDVVNRGIINFSVNGVYNLEYRVSDAAGNISKVSFPVKAVTVMRPPSETALSPKEEAVFIPGKPNSYRTEDFALEVPGHTIYDTVYFQYRKTPGSKNFFSDAHHVHNAYTPLHSYISISIRADSLPVHLRSKAVIASVYDGKAGSAAGGSWSYGFLTARIRSFGSYAVVVDTVPPTIKAVNIWDGKIMAGSREIVFKISDNLSGIRTYRGTVDGKWVLMELDAKTSTLSLPFESEPNGTEHELVLKVTDQKENMREYKVRFVR
jgi:hypothetical protein